MKKAPEVGDENRRKAGKRKKMRETDFGNFVLKVEENGGGRLGTVEHLYFPVFSLLQVMQVLTFTPFSPISSTFPLLK